MSRYPIVIATSVIRSVHQGESHGGVYLVDLESGDIVQPVDWNDASIDWEGRGKDRGLRGIAFYKGHVYIAASNEIFVYDRHFNIVKSYTNQYLGNCHEILISGRFMYLTSTRFDSVLMFNLVTEQFEGGYTIRKRPGKPALDLGVFDPRLAGGPEPGDTLHLNNIGLGHKGLIVSGTQMPFVLEISGKQISMGPRVPLQTHNTRYYRGGILTNDTASNRIAWLDAGGRLKKSVPVPVYDVDRLLMTDVPEDHARQSFARGLSITEDGLVIGGSSPSTVSVYDLEGEQLLKSVNLTMDIRNTIHGLEIWPYA